MRWRNVIIFLALGVLCASISATLADAKYGGPNLKSFLDTRPHNFLARGGDLFQSWQFPGVTYKFECSTTDQGESMKSTVFTGWPFRSFSASHSRIWKSDAGSILISPYAFYATEPKVRLGSIRLYLRPTWGLVLNTLFYAALASTLAWVLSRLLSPFFRSLHDRRLRRAAEAGVCANCGYAVTGLHVCPECGTYVSR